MLRHTSARYVMSDGTLRVTACWLPRPAYWQVLQVVRAERDSAFRTTPPKIHLLPFQDDPSAVALHEAVRKIQAVRHSMHLPCNCILQLNRPFSAGASFVHGIVHNSDAARPSASTCPRTHRAPSSDQMA